MKVKSPLRSWLEAVGITVSIVLVSGYLAITMSGMIMNSNINNLWPVIGIAVLWYYMFDDLVYKVFNK